MVKEDPSFSEEKEAKRPLLPSPLQNDWLATPQRRLSRGRPNKLSVDLNFELNL
jgi:hypothetical protein